MAVMAFSSMSSGVELDDEESATINEATAKMLQSDTEELTGLYENVIAWINQYQKNPNQIGLWIKARLTACNRPRPGTILEYLKRGHMDWEMRL